MFRWLATNLRTFFLAFALALAVWVIAVTASNPDETQTYPTPIPIEFIGQDPGLIMTGEDVPQKVDVTLRASHSIWQSLLSGESSIHAVVDLTGLGSGTHAATVQLQIGARPVRIISVNPASFDVSLEAQVSRSMAIHLMLSGQPATGYQAGEPTLDPAGVTVSGTKSIVSQIDHVQAALDLTNTRQNISETIPLQAVDKDGNTISGAAILPDTVKVSLSVVQQGGYRDLAVKVMTVGNPASGYSLTSVSAFPPIVTVYSANSSTIDAMPGYVETSPLDLSGATQDIQERLGITLPPGVTLIGEQTVVVTVGIASIQSSRTISYSPVEMVGQAKGLSAHLSPQTVDVILSGPLPVLDSLLFSDVHVQVDLTGLAPGTYQLTPKVSINKQNVIVESILPGTVEVVITGMGTPTP
jgi:YbbR domain-containing protein